MYPEGVFNNDPANGQTNDWAAAQLRPAAPRPRFFPRFARRRSVRALLLATAVVAVSFALSRHHGPHSVTADGPAAATDAWHPPIGPDRSHEALDQLTLDLAAPLQTLIPSPGFQQGADTSGKPAPAGKPAHDDRSTRAQQPHEAPAPQPEDTAGAETGDVNQYLWDVYERSKTKRDASGDFTWKDEAAAAHMGVSIKQYVIGGMDPDFRELLYTLGHALDAAKINWTILSGFRDDYRQGLASGYKAHVGNSFHGGSRATGGYGHGCAADIESTDGEDNSAVWKWVDQHGEKFGIFRPMKVIDPAHIQPTGEWHDIALNLRDKRDDHTFLPASLSADEGTETAKPLVDTPSGVSESQFDCVRSHHASRMASSHHAHAGSHIHRAMNTGKTHRFGRRRMIVESTGRDKHARLEASASDDAGDTSSRTRRHAATASRRVAARSRVVADS